MYSEVFDKTFFNKMYEVLREAYGEATLVDPESKPCAEMSG